MKKNFNDEFGLEASRSKVNPEVLNVKDDLGTSVAKVIPKKKEYKINSDTFEKVVRASKHSPKTIKDLIDKVSKLIMNNQKDFEKEDDTPDFKLHDKANKAATIVATPDGGRPQDTNIEVKSYSSKLDNFSERLEDILARLKLKIEESPNANGELDKNTVVIHIDNINGYRDRFEKTIGDKYKYFNINDGDYRFPKILYNYFKEILKKINVPYSIVD